MELKQFVPSEFCLACDVCCRFSEANSVWSPVLTDTDIRKIPKDLINKNNKFELVHYKDVYLCPCFSPVNNKCGIYNNRPLDCMLYPFLLARRNNKIFLSFDLKCPFLQKKQESPEFKDYVKYLVEFLDQDELKELIKRNQQIIGDYQEDVVFLQEISLK